MDERPDEGRLLRRLGAAEVVRVDADRVRARRPRGHGLHAAAAHRRDLPDRRRDGLHRGLQHDGRESEKERLDTSGAGRVHRGEAVAQGLRRDRRRDAKRPLGRQVRLGLGGHGRRPLVGRQHDPGRAAVLLWSPRARAPRPGRVRESHGHQGDRGRPLRLRQHDRQGRRGSAAARRLLGVARDALRRREVRPLYGLPEALELQPEPRPERRKQDLHGLPPEVVRAPARV
mmetsp:Transcript_5166/g.16296  ORF Transcript_5166/g.16296 Transcript_5166/m.16296 type:complete len:230 (-) Transcript_5166:104-793(-)